MADTATHAGAMKIKYSRGMSKKHPGFQAVQASIAAKEGVSSQAAGKILGAATAKNPTLKARAAAARHKHRHKKRPMIKGK